MPRFAEDIRYCSDDLRIAELAPIIIRWALLARSHRTDISPLARGHRRQRVSAAASKEFSPQVRESAPR